VGTFGQYCNETINICSNTNCVHGQCIPGTNQCSCPVGFHGLNCDLPINYCSNNPCKSGECVSVFGDFKCICPPNKTGKRCQNDFNVCSAVGCINGRCIEMSSGQKCACYRGFTGERCEIKMNSCEVKNPCLTGTCISNGTEFECKNCAAGYTGPLCSEPINFCEADTCKNGGTCKSIFNGYICQCPINYTGKNCTETDKSECFYNGKCRNGATCISENNKFIKCDNCDRSKFSGEYCEKIIDKCANVTCVDGTCQDGQCKCSPNDPTCQSKCLNNPCGKGTCIDIIDETYIIDFKCLCPPGLTGSKCNESIHCVGDVNICGNTTNTKSQSKCSTVDQSFECECSDANRYGYDCAEEIAAFVPTYSNKIEYEQYRKQACTFGNSRESRIFIGVVILSAFLFSLIGLLIGYCGISAYRR
jgi:hypothetical protein